MKKFYLILVLSLFRLCLLAQPGPNMLDIPKVLPPSPNAASLGKYGDYPVGLYTGIPNIDVPLYTISFGKFSLPISISYYAAGLKVTDIASQVGLGWSLNAGGVVTRSVNVRPDEVGYMNQGKLANLDTLVKTLDRIMQASNGSYDLVPDNFSFNFNGRSGKFIIDASTENKAHIIPFQPLQVTYPKNLDSIQIVDESGIVYRFSSSEISYTDGGVLFSPYKSSWYLTKIITPYGDVDFIYSSIPDDVVSEQLSEIHYRKLSGYCDEMSGGSSLVEIHTAAKVLKSIITPAGRINFFSNANRQDAVSQSKLDSIVVLDNSGKKIKSFGFRYSYFGKAASSNYREKRLKLDSLCEEGASSLVKKWHSFEYYLPQSVPATDSKSQDFWGFYNGKTNSTLLPDVDAYFGTLHVQYSGGNRVPNFTSTKIGMLTKISYPTGGSTSFVYEPNDYGSKEGSRIDEREQIKDFATAHAWSSPTNPNDVLLSTKDFQIQNAQDVFIDYAGTNDGPASREDNPAVYLYRVNTDGSLTTLLNRVLLRTSEDEKLYLTPGTYRLTATVDANSTQTAAIDANYFHFGDTIRSAIAGGLRIQQIINNDGITGTENIRRFDYKIESDSRRSSGDLIADVSMIERKFTNTGAGACEYLIRSSYPVIALSTTHGSLVGYSTVTEFMGDKQAGKKVSIFSSNYQNKQLQEYHAINAGDYNLISASEKYTGDNDFLRGTLLSETYFDSTNRKMARTDIIYNYDNLQNGNYFVADIIYGYTFPYCNPTYCQLCCEREASNRGYRLVPSRIICPWIYEVQRKETFYGIAGDQELVKTVNNYYENPVHAQLTRQTETASDGKTETSYFRYPLDFGLPNTISDPDAAGIKYLQNKHIVGSIIEKYTLGPGASDISGVVTTYNSDKPFPKAIWGFEQNETSNNYSPALINNGVFLKDNRYKQRITFDQYDSTGNILQQGKVYDAPTAYLWGYNNQYPVASIVGATYTAVSGIINKNVLLAPTTPQVLRDELNKLRTSLPGALVTTYTYIPLVGINSETDPAGRTTYYEYDALGRLKLIKDRNGKILKQIEYQYKASINK